MFQPLLHTGNGTAHSIARAENPLRCLPLSLDPGLTVVPSDSVNAFKTDMNPLSVRKMGDLPQGTGSSFSEI